MLGEIIANFFFIGVGALLGGIAYGFGGLEDDARLVNPMFWMVGIPLGFIAVVMVLGGLWELVALMFAGAR